MTSRLATLLAPWKTHRSRPVLLSPQNTILNTECGQRSYIEGLETNHMRHRRLLYLRAQAMLNSAIHTSGCVGRGGFLEATRENLLLCISLGVFRYQ